jgi:hypothetical protein
MGLKRGLGGPGANTIGSLPDAVLAAIFERVHAKDRASVLLACKRWNAVAGNTPSWWEELKLYAHRGARGTAVVDGERQRRSCRAAARTAATLRLLPLSGASHPTPCRACRRVAPPPQARARSELRWHLWRASCLWCARCT